MTIVEATIFSMLVLAVAVAVLAVMWVFIVRIDLVDRLAVWSLEFWEGFPGGDRKQPQLLARFLKANREGLPVDGEEFSNVPGYARSEKFRRTWYGIVGLVFATNVGVFGWSVLNLLYVAFRETR